MIWRWAAAFVMLGGIGGAASADEGDVTACYQAATRNDPAGLPACSRAIAQDTTPSATRAANISNRGYVRLAAGDAAGALADFDAAGIIADQVGLWQGDIVLGRGLALLALGKDVEAEKALLNASEYEGLKARANTALARIKSTPNAKARLSGEARRQRGTEIKAAEAAIERLEGEVRYGAKPADASRHLAPLKAWLAAILTGENVGPAPLLYDLAAQSGLVAEQLASLESAGRFDEALDLLDRKAAADAAARSRPMDNDDRAYAIEKRAELLARAGKLEDSMGEYQRARALGSNKIFPLRIIARIQDAMGDSAGAQASRSEADRLQGASGPRPGTAQPRDARLAALLRSAKAHQDEMARAQPPNNPLKIEELRRKGDIEGAIALALENAVDQFKKWQAGGATNAISRGRYADSAVLVADLRSEAGDFPKAEATLAQVQAQTGEPKYVQLAQGYLALRRKQGTEAARLFQAGIDWCRNGDSADAERCAASRHAFVARYYVRAGDKAHAREQWEAAYPGLVRARLLTIETWGTKRMIDALP